MTDRQGRREGVKQCSFNAGCENSAKIKFASVSFIDGVTVEMRIHTCPWRELRARQENRTRKETKGKKQSEREELEGSVKGGNENETKKKLKEV